MGTMTAAALKRVTLGFEAFRNAAGFGAIRSEADYDRALALVEAIMTATRDKPEREDAGHPLSALLDLLVPAIHQYEVAHHPIPQAAPHEVLAYLMESHQLRQADLPEVGNQSVVSQVLSGKRRLNARQIAALARRFKVSADVFVDEARATA